MELNSDEAVVCLRSHDLVMGCASFAVRAAGMFRCRIAGSDNCNRAGVAGQVVYVGCARAAGLPMAPGSRVPV